MSIVCGSPEHESILGLAITAIVLYPVGIMLLNTWLLVRCRNAILTSRPTQLSKAIEFLHGEYEREYYYWECADKSPSALALLIRTLCRWWMGASSQRVSMSCSQARGDAPTFSLGGCVRCGSL